MKETLTKENFWNEVSLKYPKATKLFCDWIDEYKEKNNWKVLFNETQSHYPALHHVAPKFHELPYAIQQGIWIEFAEDTLDNYFEQPDYQYYFDLAEDIKEVLSELETVIDDPDE